MSLHQRWSSASSGEWCTHKAAWVRYTERYTLFRNYWSDGSWTSRGRCGQRTHRCLWCHPFRHCWSPRILSSSRSWDHRGSAFPRQPVGRISLPFRPPYRSVAYLLASIARVYCPEHHWRNCRVSHPRTQAPCTRRQSGIGHVKA